VLEAVRPFPIGGQANGCLEFVTSFALVDCLNEGDWKSNDPVRNENKKFRLETG
jgi:hypothetical protein